MKSRAARALSTPAARRGLLVVLLYACALTYFVWNTAFAPLRQSYRVQWSTPWIGHPDGTNPDGFFRKVLYISVPVRHAWVQVMALDAFELVVNGRPVDTVRRVGTTVTAVFDITERLRPGPNLIAVESRRLTQGPSRIVVEGGYLDWRGQTLPIRSDATWRVSRLPDHLAGEARWRSTDFDDASWLRAAEHGWPTLAQDSKVNYPPALYSEPAHGRWSWPASAGDSRALIRCAFDVPKAREVWLSVSAYETYSLFVNGTFVGAEDDWVGVSGLPTGRGRPLGMYNVTRFVSAGRNVAAFTAVGPPSRRKLIASALVTGGGPPQVAFETPGGCRAVTASTGDWTTRAFDDSAWPALEPVSGAASPLDAVDTRRIVLPRPPEAYTLLVLGQQTAVLALSLVACIGVWVAAADALRRRRRDASLGEALAVQSIGFVWGAVALGTATLLGFDIRLTPAAPFQWPIVLGSVGLVLLMQLLALGRPVPAPDEAPSPAFRAERALTLGAVLLLSLLALVLRLRDAGNEPLTGDEVTMALSSLSVFTKGFPASHVAANLPAKYLTTSELVAYPMAVFIKIFGLSELGVRFNGIFWGVATVPLLYFAGRQMFDGRTGLLAAALFAWLPFAVKMSHYARYPSQLAFFATLTVMLLHRALAEPPLRPRRYWAAVAACAAAYLSWEGSAFLTIGLLVGVLALRRRDISWLREPYLWLGVGLYGLVVFVQLSWRLLLNADWPNLGLGISQLMPVPLWNQPLYDPWTYRPRFFMLENLQTVSLMAALGLLFMGRDRALAYVNAVLLTVMALMTNLIETQDPRHVYFLLPLLLLSGAASFWHVASALAPRPGRLAFATRWALVLLFLLSNNTYVLKLYGMPGNHSVEDVRPEADRPYGVKVAFASAAGPGRPLQKPIVSFQPHVAWFYLGRADFYAEARLQIPVAVSVDGAQAVHRLTGSPLVYSLDDLGRVVSENPWAYVVVPRHGGRLVSREVRRFLSEQMTVIYEDEEVRVYTLGFASRNGGS